MDIKKIMTSKSEVKLTLDDLDLNQSVDKAYLLKVHQFGDFDFRNLGFVTDWHLKEILQEGNKDKFHILVPKDFKKLWPETYEDWISKNRPQLLSRYTITRKELIDLIVESTPISIQEGVKPEIKRVVNWEVYRGKGAPRNSDYMWVSSDFASTWPESLEEWKNNGCPSVPSEHLFKRNGDKVETIGSQEDYDEVIDWKEYESRGGKGRPRNSDYVLVRKNVAIRWPVTLKQWREFRKPSIDDVINFIKKEEEKNVPQPPTKDEQQKNTPPAKIVDWKKYEYRGGIGRPKNSEYISVTQEFARTWPDALKKWIKAGRPPIPDHVLQ